MDVLFYAAIVLSLTLAATCGMLYFYAMFLEARGRQLKRRVAELERLNAGLLEELKGERSKGEAESAQGQEFWPEVLDEGSGFSTS